MKHRILGTIVVAALAVTSCGGRSSEEDITKGAALPTVAGGLAKPVVAGKLPIAIPIVQGTSVANMADPNGTKVILAFGDSYGSGEGNPYRLGQYDKDGVSGSAEIWRAETTPDKTIYYSGSNTGLPSVGDARCHRSDASGIAKAVSKAVLANKQVPIRFMSFACSGAEVRHLFLENYAGANRDYGTAEPAVDIKPQVQQATEWLANPKNAIAKDAVSAVYLSISGNDVGFATVVKKCFVTNAGTCRNDSEVLDKKSQIPTVKGKVSDIASKLRKEFPNAVIMFSAYPNPLGVSPSNSGDINQDGICSRDDKTPSVRFADDWMWNISTEDAKFLQDQFLKPLNAAIKDGVTSSGPGVVFVDAHVPNGVGTLGFCSTTPNVRFNDEAKTLQGCDEPDCGSYVGLIFVSKGAWHPNELGYEEYAKAIYSSMQMNGVVPTSTSTNQWLAAPADPRGPWPTAVTSAGKFSMAWSDLANNEDYYEVQYQTGSAKATLVNLPANSKSFEFSGTANAVAAYTFGVRACHKHAANGSPTCSNWRPVSVSNATPTGTPSAATCDNGSGYGMGGNNVCVARFNLPAGMTVSTANFAYVEVRNGATLVGSAIVPVNGGGVNLTYNKEPVGTAMNFTTQLWVCSIVDGGRCVTGPNGTFAIAVSEPKKSVISPTVPRSVRPGVQVPQIAGGPPPIALNPLFESGSQCKSGSCAPPGFP